MADWNCVSKTLNHGGDVYNGRSNGVNGYGIRAEHIEVEGGYVALEIRFRDDWNKSTETQSLRSGEKRSYTDPDSGKWEVRVTSISGSGIWATATVEACYYGGPYAEITNLIYPPSMTAGDEFDCTPSICNTGNLGGSFDIKYYEGAALIKTAQHGRFDAGDCGTNLSGRLTMPDHDLTVTVKMCLRGTTTCYDERTVTINIETAAVGNGFTIKVSNVLATKNVLVAHVVKMPFLGVVGPDPNLWYWPQAFDYVGGKWYMADPATTYRVEVGDITETIPPFNKLYGTGSFADGIHCVVLAEGDGGIGSLIFKGEDVFQLFSGSPTEIFLSSTSNDVLTEAVMGPVCDFFGIPRGSACNSFWAEFNDAVFISNYVSILTTGKDTLGNARELSAFDTLALPFAFIGVLAPNVPFGKFISKGLEGIWMGGRQFTDAAFNWMKNVTINVPPSMHLDKDTLTFMEAIVRLNPDAHIDEVMSMIADGHYDDALSRMRQYLPEDFGSVDWWEWNSFNDALKKYLTTDQFNQLMDMMRGFSPQADTVIGVARQTFLSPDDLAKIASASRYPRIMDAATLGVYRSLKILDTATPQYIDEVRNILKNSPEISTKLVAFHKKTLDDVAAGRLAMDKGFASAILNHADIAPDDIVGMVKTADNLPLIVNKLSNGTYSQALGNFLDSTKKYWDCVNTHVGKTEADTWVRNNAEISKKALSMPDADVARMADIPHSAQEAAAKQDTIIEEAVAAIPEVSKVDAEDIIFGAGMKVGNEIAEVTQTFADEVPTNWYTKARQRTFAIPNRIIAKWKSLKRYEKVLCIWFMVDNVAFIVYMIAKFLGLGPGDRGFAAWNLAKSTTDAKWLCKESCEDKRYGDLSNDIKILEDAIINLEDYLDQYEFSLKLSNSYDGPKTVLDIGKSSLKLYQECLTNRGVEVAPSTGKIVFFAIDSARQAVTAGAYVDGWRVGTIWGSGLEISEVDPGSYDLEVKASGYIGCEDTVDVIALKTETFECTLQQFGDCSPVTDVRIYVDPLSPYEDQTVSFNGSADSDNPITKWEWKFGDGFTATGQAVTHPYSSAGIYTVVLIVTNDCGESESTTRNITVTEEEPPTESTTLQIETPIGTDGNDIPRYWEIEIWVDGKDTACNPPKTLTFGTDVFCDCTSPWNLVPCELGTHMITLKKYGYTDKSISVYMEKDTPKTWHSPVMVVSTAPPTQHTISFSVPIGSIAYVDGKQLT